MRAGTKIKDRFQNIAGQRFGKLVAVDRFEQTKNGTWKWNCVCDCGTSSQPRISDLRYGNIRSCGCEARLKAKILHTTHGMHNSPTYLSWKSMHARCSNPNNPDYIYYGGRGIIICDRWRSFEAFFEDMGERPKGYSLDRIDTNGNYEPDNCKWSTAKEQANNRRKSKPRKKKDGVSTIEEMTE